MYDSSTPQPMPPPAPTLGLRIAVMQRRYRFAALLSRFSGEPLERAWRAFRPLPAPDGAWGVPTAPEPGDADSSHGAVRK